jgi:hypothetical protein
MIKLNDVVPLNLQLFDGDENMSVKCMVIDASQKTVFEGELLHVANGLYETRQFRMPNTDFVVVSYTVFSGKKESDYYARASDLFFRDKSVDNTAQITEIVDTLSQKFPDYSDFYTGRLVE